MADFTFATRRLVALVPALQQIATLSPPPSAKGRYALAKILAKAEPAYAVYQKEALALVERLAPKGGVRPGKLPDTIEFDLVPDQQPTFRAESEALLDEEVVLEGIRAITHAELGSCPITIAQERVLIECGLLDDVEPA